MSDELHHHMEKVHQKIQALEKKEQGIKAIQALLGTGILKLFKKYYKKIAKSGIDKVDLNKLKAHLEIFQHALTNGKLTKADSAIKAVIEDIEEMETHIENAKRSLEASLKKAA